jgi:hypothetical protein
LWTSRCNRTFLFYTLPTKCLFHLIFIPKFCTRFMYNMNIFGTWYLPIMYFHNECIDTQCTLSSSKTMSLLKKTHTLLVFDQWKRRVQFRIWNVVYTISSLYFHGHQSRDLLIHFFPRRLWVFHIWIIWVTK